MLIKSGMRIRLFIISSRCFLSVLSNFHLLYRNNVIKANHPSNTLFLCVIPFVHPFHPKHSWFSHHDPLFLSPHSLSSRAKSNVSSYPLPSLSDSIVGFQYYYPDTTKSSSLFPISISIVEGECQSFHVWIQIMSAQMIPRFLLYCLEFWEGNSSCMREVIRFMLRKRDRWRNRDTITKEAGVSRR